MTKKTKNLTPIVASVVGVIALLVGYILGATIGFGSKETKNNNQRWVGVYTNNEWNGKEHVSITLNADGTCVRPYQGGKPCTYEVRESKVYFNGETDSYATIGDTGLVYHSYLFEKLK